jgi:hypothetical protein
MLDYRLMLVTAGFGACLMGAPQRCEAQRSEAPRVVYYTYSTNSADMTGCRGFTSIHRAVWSRDEKRKDSLNVSYPIAQDVDPRSPSGMGGLANGDSIVMINRFTTLGARDPELSLWNLDEGDFNRMRVKRGSETIELSFHMGAWAMLPGDSTVADPSTGKPTRRVCRAAK